MVTRRSVHLIALLAAVVVVTYPVVFVCVDIGFTGLGIPGWDAGSASIGAQRAARAIEHAIPIGIALVWGVTRMLASRGVQRAGGVLVLAAAVLASVGAALDVRSVGLFDVPLGTTSQAPLLATVACGAYVLACASLAADAELFVRFLGLKLPTPARLAKLLAHAAAVMFVLLAIGFAFQLIDLRLHSDVEPSYQRVLLAGALAAPVVGTAGILSSAQLMRA